MTILSEKDLELVGRANQLLHYLNSSKYCGYCGSVMEFDSTEEAMFCKCNNLANANSIILLCELNDFATRIQ